MAEFVGIGEAARQLGVSQRTLGRWVVDGAPVHYVDGRKLFEPVTVDAWARSAGKTRKAGRPVGSIRGAAGGSATRVHPTTKREALQAGASVAEVEAASRQVEAELAGELGELDGVKLELLRAELRRRLAAAEKLELENADARAELVAREVVEAENAARAEAVGVGLELLAARMTARLGVVAPGLSASVVEEVGAEIRGELGALAEAFAG